MKAKFILAAGFAASVLAVQSPAGVSSEPAPEKFQPAALPEPEPEIVTSPPLPGPFALTVSEIDAVEKSGMAPSDIDCYVLTEMKHPDDKDYISEVNFHFARKLDATDKKVTHVNDMLAIMAKRREEFRANSEKAKRMTQQCHQDYKTSLALN